MAPIHPNLTDFNSVSVAMFALASSVTSLRLVIRFRNHHWWWDDSLALLSMILMGVLLVGTNLLDQAAQPRRVQIDAYYVIVTSYYATIWGARLSILFTIIRIAPWPRQRTVLNWFAAFFVFQWMLLTVQVYWVCEITDPQWKQQVGTLCFLGKAVPICQVITTLISDLTLVVSPLFVLRKASLNGTVRFRLISVFCVSMATTVAALVHSVLVITSPGAWEAISGAVECGVALTVCNASVIIPLIGRRISTSATFQDDGGENMAKRTKGSKPGDNTVLSTLKIQDMGSTTFPVDASVDETHDADRSQTTLWDKKTNHTLCEEVPGQVR